MSSTPRRITTTVALVAALLLGAVTPAAANPPSYGSSNSTEWYKPGVPYSGVHPDPSVASMGGLLFTYGTNHGSSNLPVGWSADGITWPARTQYEGSLGMRDGYGYYNDGFPDMPWTPSGVQREAWAPSVAHIGGRWVAFVSVRIANPGRYTPYGRFAIYVAVADNPMGPFRAASSSPIVSTSTSSDPGGAIDPDVMVDEITGRAFLIWKTEGNLSGNYPAVWGRELSSNGTSFAGAGARKLISVSQGWEGRVVENPSMTKVNGRYVLLYSGNEYRSASYATGVATCSGPLGPCTKSSANPILRSATGAYGPGGADGIVDARGRFIAVYHAWTSTSGGRGTGYRRQHVMQLSDPTSGLRVVKRYIDNGKGPDNLWSHTPSGSYASSSPRVAGSYIPAAGDFTGDGYDDIAFYGPWDRPDSMWTGTATAGRFGSAGLDQRGTFVPLAGDFDADGIGDIYWYQPGPDPKVADPNQSGGNHEPNARPDQLWLGGRNGWTKRNLSMPWAAAPSLGDFDGNGTTDILWAQPGRAADTIWSFGTDGIPRSRALSVHGYYRPVVGDFDGDGIDDIFWYGPGRASDSIWWFNADGGYTKTSTSVTGTEFRPFAGDFDGNGRDDIIWYTPGPGFDSRWEDLHRSGRYTNVRQVINGVYTPVVGDYDGNQVDDIYWYS